MAERYTRGEILGARRFAEWELEQAVNFGLCTTASSWRVILAALDAYDSQRPRPASEVPKARACVLVRLRSQPDRYHAAWYDPRCSEPKRWVFEAHNHIDPCDILDWLPFPSAPERDDG